MDFTGILLAGGKSTRFGINKIKIEFKEVPLLADQIIKLGFFCNEVLISSSDENSYYISQVLNKLEQYKEMLLNPKPDKIDAVLQSGNNESPILSEYNFKKPAVRIKVDNTETRPGGKRIGPLAGIFSGLKEAKNKNCLVLAQDMPFVSYRVLRLLTLTSEKTGKDAVIIRNPKGIEALCGIYSKDHLNQIQDSIGNGIYKISKILEDCEVEWIDSSKIRREKIDMYNFFNINTAEDIKNFNLIREKGITGIDPGKLKGEPHIEWKAFFYRGID
jgi:molybdopterin-guanine dinucleotide biosynthesis protein A